MNQGYPQYGAPGMQPYPYAPPNNDEQHLNVLSICTFVYAGLVALVGLFFSIYLVLGVFIAGAAATSGGAGAAEAEVMGGVFAVIGLLLMAFAFAKAALLVMSGLGMRRRKRATLSFVTACLCCLNIPLGLTLGIFTILVLNRPSVKALYAQAALSA